MDLKNISVIIANYNGKDIIAECLDGVLKAVQKCEGKVEIMLVDDASSDGGADFVKENYPSVKVLRNEKNLGFGGTNNRGVQEAKHDLVMILNSDMILFEDCLALAPRYFQEDGSVFAIQPMVYSYEKKAYEGGYNGVSFWRGRIHTFNQPLSKLRDGAINLHAGGGGIFRKDRYLLLGGFDELYTPFYYEDLDLCVGAWRKGWKTLFSEKCKLHHKHKGTIRTHFQEIKVKTIQERNRDLFLLKHAEADSALRKSWQRWRPYHWLQSLLTGNKAMLNAMKQVRERRRLIRPMAAPACSLEEIIATIRNSQER